MSQPVSTADAPAAIGAYSQAIRTGETVYLSGQIGLDPETMELVAGDFEKEARQVFKNLTAVIAAAGGTPANAVKLTIYLTEMDNFQSVNAIMAEFFGEPYPARAAIGVASLPRGAQVEVDGILVLER